MAWPRTAGPQGAASALDLHPKMLYAQRDKVLYEIVRRPEARRRSRPGLSSGRVWF